MGVSASRKLEVRPVKNLLQKRSFVDLPFRMHGDDPDWVPPLRWGVYDRLSKRHPSRRHQRVALWMAFRHGRPVGRVGACIDTAFNDYQDVKWGWVGFFESLNEPDVAAALFDTACGWCREQGAETAVGPANFTTNDELGLLVEGFDEPAAVLTLQNPRYYEDLFVGAGWEPAMDLWAWHFDRFSTELSERQRHALDRIRQRAGVHARSLRTDEWDAEVERFFEVYNAAWSRNWGFAPLPEVEVRHLARQLKPILRKEWAFGLENAAGEVVGVCLALPDVNAVLRPVRSGRLLPFTWARLIRGRLKVTHCRIWALGVRPGQQNAALGPLLYQEIVDRLKADPYILTGEASWTLASNTRINKQLEAMGARRSKVWRLYQRAL